MPNVPWIRTTKWYAGSDIFSHSSNQYSCRIVIITTTTAEVHVKRPVLRLVRLVRVSSHSVPISHLWDVNISATHAQLPPKIPPRLISTQ